MRLSPAKGRMTGHPDRSCPRLCGCKGAPASKRVSQIRILLLAPIRVCLTRPRRKISFLMGPVVSRLILEFDSDNHQIFRARILQGVLRGSS